MKTKSSLDRQVYEVGIYCSYITAICYMIVCVLALFSPKPIATYIASKQYFVDFHNYKYYFIGLKCLLALANATLVGVFLSIYHLKSEEKGGWLLFFSILAMIGAGIGMFQSVLDATQIPHLASEYEVSSPEIKHIIIAFGVADPAIYALSLGLPGIWFFFVSWLYRKRFPMILILLTFLWGLGSILTIIAHLFAIVPILYLVALGALITTPLWAICQTKFLKQELSDY